MAEIREGLSIVFLLLGLFFCLVGIIGLIRFPDVYTRIHASGKVSTVGLVGLLIGTALAMPQVTLKAAALAIFVVLTAPVASHAIASAAYRQGIPIGRSLRDDLATRPREEESSSIP